MVISLMSGLGGLEDEKDVFINRSVKRLVCSQIIWLVELQLSQLCMQFNRSCFIFVPTSQLL